jgi:16S rRNA (cytidine1402-2'-O)-methyltransferase
MTIGSIPVRRPGELYLVATPIGNLEDITLRALRTLKEVDLIACEDTRHTQKLLAHYAIEKRLVSYHEHNENTRSPELIEKLKEGAQIALVTDAGTPVISDPGYRLARLCVEHGIRVTPIPGPSAIVTALAASGLPGEPFLFAGFLPARAGERRRKLTELATLTVHSDQPITLILYEAPHRLAATLNDAAQIFGARSAVIARELTKLHEEFVRGTLPELAAQFREKPVRGEITLLIGPAAQGSVAEGIVLPGAATLPKRVAEIMREQGINRKAALKQAARELGLNKREAYKLLLLARG